MFGDNQNQPAQDNNSTDDQAGAPASPTADGISSFTMDPPSKDSPSDSTPVIEPPSAPEPDSSDPAEPSTSLPEPESTTSSPPSDDAGLLDIKQQALTALSPMLGHLDQTPEEKFRTTMMMIQANDDKSLIKDAYAAAQQISDEKAKAQALLDVVNEINYFTHNGDNN